MLEEEERRKDEEKEKEKASRSSASSAPKRTRKKRRKKRTSETSSSRAVRTQKSGHSSWDVYSGGVMSSVACGSSILLGMYWLPQHSANSVLDCAYSWSYGVKVATFIRTR